MKPGSRRATARRSPRHPTKTVRWRCRCSSTGCRAARIDPRPYKGWARRKRAHPPRAHPPNDLLRRLKVEVDPHRDVVRRFFPGAHITIDSHIDQPVAGLRRQQEMIDAQAMVFLPGARLIIPECVLPGGVGDGTQRVREPKAKQRLKAFTGGGAEQG